jgi:hypothetical protein
MTTHMCDYFGTCVSHRNERHLSFSRSLLQYPQELKSEHAISCGLHYASRIAINLEILES